MEEQKKDSSQQSQEDKSKAEYTYVPDSKDVQENKLWAVLAYLGVLVLIPLLAKKDSKFSQFHAKQGLVLLIGWFAVWIPIIGLLLGIVIFFLAIMGILNAASGEAKPLPIIGDVAKNLNI